MTAFPEVSARFLHVSARFLHSFCIISALCLALAGCGGFNKLYTPIAGTTQSQSAESAHWACTFQYIGQDPNSFTPVVGAGAGVAAAVADAPTRNAFMRDCMADQGWVALPGYAP